MIEVPSDRVSYFQRLKHEEGSALVLVMFLVLMLTILGLAVMGATIGGAQITETRESDVQSLHLAQKGLDEATAYIQSQLKDVEDIDPDTLEGIFSSLDKRTLTSQLSWEHFIIPPAERFKKLNIREKNQFHLSMISISSPASIILMSLLQQWSTE